MTPQPELFTKLFEFTGALSICISAMAWWRKDGPKSDEVVVEAADVVLSALSDADTTNRVELHTGRDIRSQLTVEEAIEIHEERELRAFGRRN